MILINMKKILLFVVLFMSVSLSSRANMLSDNNLNLTTFSILQNNSWEYLGEVEAKCHFYSIKVNLYVKAIGSKLFYQVRDENKAYSVTLGNFSVRESKFNAKFSTSNDTFYLNVPQ